MLLASSEATSHTVGLLITFIGIGIIVNIIIVYILIQVRGERGQNEEFAASRKPPSSG